MKRVEQVRINNECERVWDDMLSQFVLSGEFERLGTCKAAVFDTGNYYVLQSYATLVACIDKSTNTLYDMLRKVYGYTNTSAYHISKFSKDYGAYCWGCDTIYRWREV